MQNEMLMTIVTIVALTLFAWIAWRKARSGPAVSWIQEEEARLKDRYLDNRPSFNRD